MKQGTAHSSVDASSRADMTSFWTHSLWLVSARQALTAGKASSVAGNTWSLSPKPAWDTAGAGVTTGRGGWTP